jgi:tRNA pseudouridine55 synthase
MARQKRPVTLPPLIFNVYKPVGPTSADVVQHFKRNLPQGFGKIGHLGTLDPFAEGVLLVAVAGAARVNDYFHEASPKHYRALGNFGIQTDTGDLQGKMVEQKEIPPAWSDEELKNIESSLREKFCGSYWQKVPQYSAVKHKGKPLYEYARQGEIIEKPKVLRRVYQLNILRRDKEELEIEAVVGTGTYIRSLFEDICDHLGTCGHLKKLVRTRVGAMEADQALFEPEWPVGRTDFDCLSLGLQLDQALPLPTLKLDLHESKRYSHGQALHIAAPDDRVKLSNNHERLDLDGVQKICWVLDEESNLCGLGHLNGVELRVGFNLPKILA